MAKETTTKTTKKATKAKATEVATEAVASQETNVNPTDRVVAEKLMALSRLQETCWRRSSG